MVVQSCEPSGGTPNIFVDPLSLSSLQAPNTTAMETLTISNTGDADLSWMIQEEDTTAAPMPNPEGYGATGPADFGRGSRRGGPAVAPAASANASIYRQPEVLLYDNGPLVTHPAGGFGGTDASAVRPRSTMSVYGFGFQASAGNRIADDFTVTDADGWNDGSVTFFGYQTGSTTTSTFTGLNLQIWDGPPDNPASSVVWGDTTTNLLANSISSNSYRVLDTDLTASNRPVMADTATVGARLPAGTYWLDWQADGSLASGPWAPPISILGTTTTGNAMQYTSTGWAALIDTGSAAAQGLPFVIEGSTSGAPDFELPFRHPLAEPQPGHRDDRRRRGHHRGRHLRLHRPGRRRLHGQPVRAPATISTPVPATD